MLDVKVDKKDENNVLIIADDFSEENSPVANPIRLVSLSPLLLF